MNLAVFLGKKLLRLALHRLPLNISSILGDLVCALSLLGLKDSLGNNLSSGGVNYNLAYCLRLFGHCIDDLSSIGVSANLADYLGFFNRLICYIVLKNDNLTCIIVRLFYDLRYGSIFSRLDCLGVFIKNNDLACLGGLCRDYLSILGKLADCISAGLFYRSSSYYLLALLVGGYGVLKLGSTLDLLSLSEIYGECIFALLDLFLRLSLESLRRVGLFCNYVCAGSLFCLCDRLVINYSYGLLANVKNLFLRLYGGYGSIFSRLDCLGVFIKNNDLACLGGLCRDYLSILGKLADCISAGLFYRSSSYYLLALLVGGYGVLKLGSTLDLLSLSEIYGECIFALLDLFLRLSLESLRRVGLFCNYVCAGSLFCLCDRLVINYSYGLLANVKNLFLRLYGGYGSRGDILLNYYTAVILLRIRLSCSFGDYVAA